jgi:hypothetical protein
MTRHHVVCALAALAFVGFASPQAFAQQKLYPCGDVPNPSTSPRIAPIFHGNADLNDAGFDCMIWQDFIYLNWPATPGQRGVPNAKARFGAAGPTVWETYKTVDQVFLPNAQNPGPWNAAQALTTLAAPLAQRVARGEVRRLTTQSKISRSVLGNIMLHSEATLPILNEISQAGGGTLYDLNGYPVYYEVAMNKVQYDYIVANKLFNASEQIAFAQTKVISLPAAPADGQESAVEIKAAWKVLSQAERTSGRFHTIQALLDGSKTPVTVGLVGFHMFVSNGAQGAWGTIAQIDNAPVAGGPTSGSYNFFNPNCKQPGTSNPCPVNVKDANPGQVLQVNPNNQTATSLNAFMQAMLKSYDAKTPWQYYKLIDVQWALQPVEISRLKAPASVPLPDGKPNRTVVVNPVIETFVQSDGIGCFSCHQYATIAGSGTNKPPYASSYSFTFGRATTPK